MGTVRVGDRLADSILVFQRVCGAWVSQPVSGYTQCESPHIQSFCIYLAGKPVLYVREKLGLSYHNMCVLLQKVDSMPERAPWKEGWLTFKDRPGECHLVQFRDIIKALKALLGNRAHADQIVW